MTYELMWDGSVRIFHKGHFVRIWLDKVTVDDIVIDIDIHQFRIAFRNILHC